jgi:hypothetical protein
MGYRYGYYDTSKWIECYNSQSLGFVKLFMLDVPPS